MINDLNAAIPLRSAQTEVQNTIAQRQQQQTQSHLETSVTLRAQFETDWTAKGRRPKPSRKRANFSPQRNFRLPEETQCLAQILTFKSYLGCHCSNAIYRNQQWFAKHNQSCNTVLENKVTS